jgi:hypothetical protein
MMMTYSSVTLGNSLKSIIDGSKFGHEMRIFIHSTIAFRSGPIPTHQAVTNGDPPARRKTTKRESRLRFQVLNAFLDCGMATLSRSELALWLILYRDTKRHGTARVSLADIARRAYMDRQTASRAVGKLVRRNMLQVLRRGELNQGPSEFRVFPVPME